MKMKQDTSMGHFLKHFLILFLSLTVTFLCGRFFKEDTIRAEIVAQSTQKTEYRLFYSKDRMGFNETDFLRNTNKFTNQNEMLEFSISAASVDGLRLSFMQSGENGTIRIDSLKINGEKISLPYIFSRGKLNDIGSVVLNHDTVMITTSGRNPYVVMPEDVSGYKAKRHYRSLPLLTVFIITLLLTEGLFFFYFPHFYMESDTNAKVTEKLVFIAVVAILLTLPVTHFDQSDTSTSENRMLASFPVFLTQKGLNPLFGREFEAWLNDRFAGRGTYLKIHDYYNSAFYTGKFENEKAFKGKEDWLFYKAENSVELYQGKLDFTKKQMELIAANLQQQKQWMTSQDILYSVFIAPNKEDVYFEYYDPHINKSNKIDRIQRLKQFLDDTDSGISFVYPLRQFLNEKTKDKLLYWKNDTHWSEYGAYFGYLVWMKELKKLNRDVNVLQPDQFRLYSAVHKAGDLQQMLKMDRDARYDDLQYAVPKLMADYKYIVTETGEDSRKNRIIRTVCPERNFKVIVFRDSFAENLLPYLSSTFHEVIYVWSHDVDSYKGFIQKEKPDIILHEMVSRFAHLLLVQPDAAKGER